MRVGRTSIGSRIISMLLVICMVLGMVPATALPVFAAESSNADTILEYAQDKLSENHNKTGAFTWDTEGKTDGWRYFNGVMLEAFLQNGLKVSDTQTAYSFAQNFFDHYINESGNSYNDVLNGEYSTAEKELDGVPPARNLAQLVGHVGFTDSKYANAVKVLYNNTIGQDQVSNTGGNFIHKEDNKDWEGWQVGLDGVYMAQPFLMEVAKAVKEERVDVGATYTAIADGVYSRLNWIATNMKYQTSDGVYLYHHGWGPGDSYKNGNGVTWSRGAGWWVAGLADCIALMEDIGYDSTKITTLKGHLKEAIDGLLKYQDPTTGMWYNVIYEQGEGVPTSNNFLETSGTGLFAYTIMKAYTREWLTDAKYGQAALNAIDGIMSDSDHYSNGSFKMILKSSGVYDTVSKYNTAQSADEAKGVGPIIMAASMYDDVYAMVNGTSKETEVFQIGAVSAPDITVNLNETPDYSGVIATVISNKGTIKDVTSSDLSFSEIDTSSVGMVTVTVYSEDDIAIDTFSVTVVDPDAVVGNWEEVAWKTETVDDKYLRITLSELDSTYLDKPLLIGFNKNGKYAMTVDGTSIDRTDSLTVTQVSGTNYYTFSSVPAEWYISKNDSTYVIYTKINNQNYYISTSGTNTSLTTNSSSARQWTCEALDGSMIGFYYVDSSKHYFLFSGDSATTLSSQNSLNYSDARRGSVYAVIDGGEGATSTTQWAQLIGKSYSISVGDTLTEETIKSQCSINTSSKADHSDAKVLAWSDSSVSYVWDTDLDTSTDGTYTMTVKVNGEAIGTIPVTVTAANGVSFTIDTSSVTLWPSDSVTVGLTGVKVDGVAQNVGDYSVVLSSGNTGVATVDGTTITAVGAGNATVTATLYQNGAAVADVDAKTISVKVNANPSITIQQQDETVAMNASLKLTPVIGGIDAGNYDLYWESLNTDIATVDQNGVVTPVAIGNATIKVTLTTKARASYSATTNVKVTGAVIENQTATGNVTTTETVPSSTTNNQASNSINADWQQTETGSDGSNSGTTYVWDKDGIDSGKQYVIVGSANDTNWYAMGIPSDPADRAVPVATGVTIPSGNTSLVEFASSNTSAYVFTITETDGAYQITITSGSNTYYVVNRDPDKFLSKNSKDTRNLKITNNNGEYNIALTDGPLDYVSSESNFYSSESGTSVRLYKVTTGGTPTDPEYAKLVGNGKTYKLDTADNEYTLETLLDQIQEDYKIHTSTTNSGEGAAIEWSDTYCEWEDGADLTKAGEYTLTVTYKTKVLGTITVAVNTTTPETEKETKYNGTLTVTPGSLNLTAGDVAEALAEVFTCASAGEGKPGNVTADSYTVIWASDNESVATVKDGVVTAVAAGTANITATVKAGSTITVDGVPGTVDEDIEVTIPVTVAPTDDHVHTYDEGVVTPPTCTTPGYTTYTCSGCGHSYTGNETEATGHSYTAVVTNPTCTAGGYTTYTCSKCDDSYTGNETEATGHSYTSQVTKQPTCTEKGVRTYTCSKCGDSYTEDIAATGHTNAAAVEENRVEATCTEPGSYDLVVYCSVCGTKVSSETKTIDALGHNYVDGVCTRCGEKDPNYDSSNTKTYVLYTGSIADITSEDKFLIVDFDDPTHAMMNPGSAGTGADLTVTISGNSITISKDDAANAEWTLNGSASGNSGAFQIVNGSLNLRTGDNGILRASGNEDEVTVAVVDQSTGKYTINLGSSNYLFYDKNDDRDQGTVWTRSRGTTEYVLLFKESTEPTYSLTVTPATSTAKPGGEVVLHAALKLGNDEVTEGVTYTWSHNGEEGEVEFENTAGVFTAGSKGETVTITVVAKDSEGNELATGTATVTVVTVTGGTLSKSEVSVANGEDVSLNDITLTLNLSDGSTKQIANSALTFDEDDLAAVDVNTAGNYDVAVTYTDSEYGYEYTGTVTVKIAAPVTISDAQLNKATMVVANGATINAGDISMVLTMSDGTTQTIPASELEIVGLDEIDPTQAGEYTVTVTYTTEDGTEYECTLTVTVKEAITEGWFLCNSADFGDGKYLIVAQYTVDGETKTVAMTNNGTANGTITEVTVVGNEAQFASGVNSAPAEWTFTYDEDEEEYSITNVYNGTTYYLKDSSSPINTDVKTADVYSTSTAGLYRIALKETNGDLSFNTSNENWTRASSANVYLYKWTGSTSSTEATLTGITLNEDKVNVANGGTVDLSKITAVATYSDGSTANLTNAQLTYDASKINTAVGADYNVTFSYTEGGKTVTDTLIVSVAAASSGGTETSDLWKHNFSVDGATDEDGFFNIKGNTTGKTGSYGDLSFNTALKIESSTSISFNAPNEGTLTLVLESSGKDIKINGTSYTSGSGGVVTVDVPAGTVTIAKDDSTSLFYMEYASAITDGISVTAPGTLYIAAAGGSLTPTHAMDYVVRHNDADVTDTEGAYTIQWSTLDSTVAIIDENGVLTGLKPGTTSVTANVTMSDGTEYSATVLVTVLGPGISSTEEMALIAKVDGKDTGAIASTVYAGGVTTTNYTLGYVSSDENVATVDEYGNVTAVGKGTATIYTYIKTVNGFEVYTGDGKAPQPAYFDSTVVTVTEKEVSDAHLNSYDYVIKSGSSLQGLVDLLEYKSDVFVESDGSIVHAEEGVKLTIQYNTGDETIVKYADDNNDGTDNGGGLVIDVGAVDLSKSGTYYVTVTYTEDGKELFRDTIWVHVEDYDPKDYDGTVIREDGIHYILDTDGIDVNEEYVIVAGNAAMAIKNPSATAVGSSVAAGAAVSMATGDLITKLDNSGNIFRENVDYLTIGDNDAELSTWLFDTMVALDNGLVQYNLSNNLRYLGSGNAETQLVHTASKHVYLETVSKEDGEYRIILGYGLDDQPYYLGYVDGIWTSTTTPSSVYLYNRVAELSGDYGFDYELREKTNKTEITEPLSIPASFVYEFVEPNIFYNNSTTALPDGEYRIVWSSSDTSVATVDQNGRITAIKEGTAVITANLYEVYGDEVICNTHNTEHVTRTVTVNVTESDPVPVLTPDELTIGVGTMPNFSKINVEMTFSDTEGEYDYEVPHDQLTFKLADATGTATDGTVMDHFDNTVPGEYEVPVSYAGGNFTLTIYVVEDPYAGLEEADSIPGFPDAGSVRMNKTAEGVLDFTETGVTKIELTAAGVSTKNSVDVVLIVDVSNSMGWSMDWFSGMTADELADATDNLKIPAAGADGTDKLDMAMAAADEFADILLNVEGGDNTVTFVTFAGADRDHGGSSSNVDSVRTPMVAIGDYATASEVFADTKFTTLEADGTGAKYVLQIGGYTETIDGTTYGEASVSGTNRGNTNYDYAFGEAIDAVGQIKAKYAAENNGASYDDSGRQIHVVFMTDGAPSHYNSEKGAGTAADTLWDGSGDTYIFLDDAEKEANVSAADWLKHIQNYNELATQLKDQIYGAYTIGFDMAHGGFGNKSWTEPEMQRVLEGLAKNTIVPVTLATDEQELNDFYTSLARALAYAGTNAKVTDKIGGNFSLFTGTSMYSTDITQGGVMSEETLAQMQAMSFPINVYSYRLVVYSDIGDSLEIINENGTVETVTVDESHLGLRVNEEPEVLETITFNATGTEAYSDLILNEDGTQKNIMTDKDGVRTINASTFTYTATLDTFIHNDVETVHANEEEIEWKIGNITDAEVSMQYYAYLDGALDNPREATAGVYATNEYAYAEYVDVYGKYVKRYYGVPQIAWGAASVTVRFYLVEKDTGRFVNRAGVTFTNPANRIFLDGRAQYEVELNNQITVNALDALAKAGLAGTNILYDVSASAIIKNSTTSGQGSVAWTMDNTLDNEYTKIADLLFDTDTSNGYGTNVILDIPVVMTDKGESLRPMAGTTVVIDYGKPMDINVFSAEEAPIATNGYVSVRTPDDGTGEHLYKMEIIGFAAYSASHDLRDYVDARNVTYTTYGDESTYFTTANGKYVVTSANGATQVRFIPNGILNGVEQVFVAAKFQEYSLDGTTASDQYYIMYKQLNIIPATVVYYETDGKMGSAYTYSNSGWTLQSGGEAGNAVQDPYAQGSEIYGYDSSYTGDTTWSNGSSYLANGAAAGTDGKFPVNASFTFTGTGFDIISRTGADQGTIRVTYTNNDTGVSQSVSVINKGQIEMYQIPVVSVDGLAHGTYTVTIEVYPGITVGSTKVLGSQFYFDAVRIYGTLTGEETIQTANMNASNEYVTSTFTVDSVYAADSEVNASFSEIRDILISAESDADGNVNEDATFSSVDSIPGAIFMDDYSDDWTMANYKTYGANNEVYLQNGNAVAFSFTLSDALSGFDIGMKSVDGTPVTAQVAIMASNATEPTWKDIAVNGCTAQFYDLLATTGYELASGSVVHVLIKNGSESGTLSLTDLKIAQAGTDAVSVVSTQDTLDAAKYMTSSQLNVLSAEFAEDSVRVADTVFMRVVTESKVESLSITNALGEEVWFSAVSAEAGGQLIWTVMLRPTLLNEQTYTVTGFAADGTYGNSASDTITVELY